MSITFIVDDRNHWACVKIYISRKVIGLIQDLKVQQSEDCHFYLGKSSKNLSLPETDHITTKRFREIPPSLYSKTGTRDTSW